MNTAVLQGLPQRAWWPWAMRALAIVFVSFIGFMLYQYARDIEWSRVGDSLRDLPKPVLATAAVLAALSHLLYSTFDLLGRHYTGHKLSAPTVMGVTFTSYAFNLNLGSIVGGVGLRFRLYSRLGLRSGAITRVLSLSLLTNWLGFMVLAGAVFALFPLPLPAEWKIGNGALRTAGFVLLAAAVAWGALVTLSARREFTVMGKRFELPGPRMTLLLSITPEAVCASPTVAHSRAARTNETRSLRHQSGSSAACRWANPRRSSTAARKSPAGQ